MYLLTTLFVSLTSTAFAQDGTVTMPPPPSPLPGQYLGCGTRPPPCLGIYTGDFTIVPGDWYEASLEALDGDLNYFRVEVYGASTLFDVQIGGTWLFAEGYHSSSESGRTSQVYYVPAMEDAEVIARVCGREQPSFTVLISGSVTEGPSTAP